MSIPVGQRGGPRRLNTVRTMADHLRWVAGLIYRQNKPVYWSPSSGTALAEAELEYDENHRSTAAFIKFPLVQLPKALHGREAINAQNIGAVIWTTTPWTLPANNAIAVHNDLEYCVIEFSGPSRRFGQLLVARARLEYLRSFLGSEDVEVIVDTIPGSQLVAGATYGNRLQGTNRQPVVHADFVSSVSGSGLVHLAAGHGMDDYNVCSKLGIPAFAPVDDEGRFTDMALPGDPDQLTGKQAQNEGAAAVLDYIIKQNASHRSFQMSVIVTHEITHKYPIDWRTKQPVIVRATEQWFADVEGIKAAALQSLQNVEFVPETGKVRLESFILGRSQWCISRQRAWGVPIPALYRTDRDSREAVMTRSTISHIMRIIDERGIDAWWTDAEDDLAWVAPELEGTYIRGKDTMDVWFDSGTTWTTLDRRPACQPVADVYIEGTDQHRGWFQSSLLTHIAHQYYPSTAETGKQRDLTAPYKTLITHGFTLDQDGRKMSKSLGNVISPEQIIRGTLLPPVKRKKQKGKVAEDRSAYDAMGADALRLWVAGSDYTRDVVVGQPVLQAVNTSLHKLRVTFKWLLGVLQDYHPGQASALANEPHQLVDRIALHHLATVSHAVHTAYTSYEFFKATNAINRYVNQDLSAFYFETLKDRMYAGTTEGRAMAQAVLHNIFNELLAMLAPVTPLLVEEVWEFAPEGIKERSKHPAKRVWTPFGALQEDRAQKHLRMQIECLTAAHDAVKTAQEAARAQKKMGSALDCDVVLHLSQYMPAGVKELFSREMEEQLAAIFVVSDVEIVVNDAALLEAEAEWCFSAPFDVAGRQAKALVFPPKRHKCVRCWRYAAPEPEALCARCDDVVRQQ